MKLLSDLIGNDLMLTKPTSSVEKAAGVDIKIHVSGKTTLIAGLCILVGFAVILYKSGQPEAGRLIIDLAVAMGGWAFGRGAGEKAGFRRASR